MNHKYIVMQSGSEELIFIFPESIAHNHMAEAVCQVRQGIGGRWTKPHFNAKPISAGFVSNDGICYGKSETLNLGSRLGLDTMLLNVGVFK
ncbi:hypothetical protein [Undibacterium sp. TJN19]|uniref:hypothetical protein n=1 Tax=Undibacterium sp. TJN19 TaxID=3413055 RepID=UPI003BF375EB